MSVHLAGTKKRYVLRIFKLHPVTSSEYLDRLRVSYDLDQVVAAYNQLLDDHTIHRMEIVEENQVILEEDI